MQDKPDFESLRITLERVLERQRERTLQGLPIMATVTTTVLSAEETAANYRPTILTEVRFWTCPVCRGGNILASQPFDTTGKTDLEKARARADRVEVPRPAGAECAACAARSLAEDRDEIGWWG